jgi:hypothetical protein
MAPTSETKLFIHVNFLEFYEGLQQCNLPTVHRLSDRVGLKAKDSNRLHQTSGLPFDLHWCFRNILQVPLDDFQ